MTVQYYVDVTYRIMDGPPHTPRVSYNRVSVYNNATDLDAVIGAAERTGRNGFWVTERTFIPPSAIVRVTIREEKYVEEG